MPITKNPASQISVLGVAPAFAMFPRVHFADDPVSEPAATEPGMRGGSLQTAPLRARSAVGRHRFPLPRAFCCRVGVPAARYDSGESTGLRASGERDGQGGRSRLTTPPVDAAAASRLSDIGPGGPPALSKSGRQAASPSWGSATAQSERHPGTTDRRGQRRNRRSGNHGRPIARSGREAWSEHRHRW